MPDPDGLALGVVFCAIFFYILYGVIRAAVRDGIGQADERHRKSRRRHSGCVEVLGLVPVSVTRCSPNIMIG